MLSHTSIRGYYHTIFGMAQHHGYSIMDLENVHPFELDIYSSMLLDYLEKEKIKAGQ